MRYLLLIIFIMLAIYLQRSYIYFYDYFNGHLLVSPIMTPIDTKSQKPKFVTMGDSLMSGVGASSEKQSFGYLLHQTLDSENKTDFINLAVPGAKIRNVLANQLPQVIEDKPKEIAILVGINDVHDRTEIKNFEKEYTQLVKNLKSGTQANITLFNVPYLGSDKILLPPWNFYMDLKTRQYNQVIAKIAKGYDLKLIDLYKMSRENFVKSSKLYSEDQFHPSDEGYKLWARNLSLY